jgi:hypothetical protein
MSEKTVFCDLLNQFNKKNVWSKQSILDYGSLTNIASLSNDKKYLKNQTLYRIIIRSDKIKSIIENINFFNLYSQNIISKIVVKNDKIYIC